MPLFLFIRAEITACFLQRFCCIQTTAFSTWSQPFFFNVLAIDRSVSSSLSDARDALQNAVVDFVSAYKSNVSNLQQSGLVVPVAMRLFPLYILALLKQVWLLNWHKITHKYTFHLEGLQVLDSHMNSKISSTTTKKAHASVCMNVIL